MVSVRRSEIWRVRSGTPRILCWARLAFGVKLRPLLNRFRRRNHHEGPVVALCCSCCVFALLVARSTRRIAQNAFTPDQIKYGPPPPFLAPGAQLAVLEGDPTASSGDFTIRLKMPDGYKIAPHWHPKRENVTVISGNFKVGMGDKFDETKMMTFPAGSFAYLDPDMHHYAMASGETSCRSTACRRCNSTT